MVFSTPIFLFFFLPIVLATYFSARGSTLRNLILLLASLLFYAWGQADSLWLLMLSVAINYGLTMLLNLFTATAYRRVVLGFAVIANLFPLFYFKYSDFLYSLVSQICGPIIWQGHPLVLATCLPLGISFFTFHCLSYVIDVYSGRVKAQRNPIDLALYISFFPQLIAGPIIRYHDICNQLVERQESLAKFAEGTRRFIIGLAKKLLIANVLGKIADEIFKLPPGTFTSGTAWLGAVCFTLQIYFDFSGYSDMAIGLCLMFGFKILENFNYPYVSSSIREFWQRWHISLSNWFKEYLYIPLGGNRGGKFKTAINLVTVFFLCGLWHGASWTFVIWGLYHGFFISIEKIGLERLIKRAWTPLQHLYAMTVVIIGWVIFRAENLQQTQEFLKAMFFLSTSPQTLKPFPVSVFVDPFIVCTVIIAIIGSLPIFGQWLDDYNMAIARKGQWTLVSDSLRFSWIMSIFFLCCFELGAFSYNPFLYFRF